MLKGLGIHTGIIAPAEQDFDFSILQAYTILHPSARNYMISTGPQIGRNNRSVASEEWRKLSRSVIAPPTEDHNFAEDDDLGRDRFFYPVNTGLRLSLNIR